MPVEHMRKARPAADNPANHKIGPKAAAKIAAWIEAIARRPTLPDGVAANETPRSGNLATAAPPVGVRQIAARAFDADQSAYR